MLTISPRSAFKQFQQLAFFCRIPSRMLVPTFSPFSQPQHLFNAHGHHVHDIPTMKPSLFSPQRNMIEHTIANADEKVYMKQETLSSGTQVTLLDNGVLHFEPAGGCDTSLIISCGIHGDETAPIEIISNIIDDLLEEKIPCVQRVLFVMGNPWAMAAADRYIEFNMNRLFCGAWKTHDLSLKEVKRAAELEGYVARFFSEEPSTVTKRYHYDCHTMIRGSACERFAIYPFVAGRKLPAPQKRFLNMANINTVLLSKGESTTFSALSSLKHNAESFTLELGKIQLLGENDLSRFSGVDSALRLLIAGERLDDAPSDSLEYYQVCHTVERTAFNWKFHVADDVTNFTELQPGTCIAEDDNGRYVVGSEPEYVVFPNPDVPVGHRAALMLKKFK